MGAKVVPDDRDQAGNPNILPVINVLLMED